MNSNRIFSIFLVVVGVIGVLASSMLIVERFNILGDPDYVPMCNIGEALDCATVMMSNQAAVFGFPNPLIGVVGFAVVLTIGMAGLAGATFKPWFWGGLQFGTIFAIVFIHWLMYHTLANIRSLCLYCMIVWAVTGPLFWYVTIRNLGAFDDPETDEPGLLTDTWISRFHWVVPAVWLVVVSMFVVNTFWL